MKEGWTFLNFEGCIEKCKKTKQLKTSDYLPEGKYPIVSQESDLISGYTNMADYVNDFGKPIVVFGDHSRVVKYIDFAFAVGADGVKILIPTNDFHPKFFYYYLHWHGVENLGYSRHYKLLKEINVPIPTLSEQQHIVEELDLLSSIIEKKKAQLKELDNLAQSLFYEMFGDPITNDKGWDKNVLNEVAKVTSSKRILQSEWQEAGIPFYKVADIVNLINGECVTPLTFIKETTYNELKSNGLVPKANDVLITSRGTIGQCYIVKEHDSFYFQDGMITWLSNINSLISPTFLVALFANDVFSDSLKHSANSSTVAYISIKQLSNMKIPIPPLALQQQFASKIEAIEHQKDLIKQSIKEVETLFNSRMDYYFN